MLEIMQNFSFWSDDFNAPTTPDVRTCVVETGNPVAVASPIQPMAVNCDPTP